MKRNPTGLSNVQRVTKEIMYVKKYIPEELPILSEINTYISEAKKKELVTSQFYNLNLKLFLDYSENLISNLEKQVKSIRLVSTKKYWEDLNEAKGALKELRNIDEANKEHVDAAKITFDNLVALQKDLDAAKQDITSETKRKFIQYYGGVQTLVTLIFFGFAGLLGITFVQSNVLEILLAYAYIALIVYVGLQKFLGLR